MKIITDYNLPLASGCVLSLGNFDGVHVGHAKLLQNAAVIAQEMNVPSVVWTFGESPLNIISGGYKIKYITGSSDKMRLLSRYGVDAVYFADFNMFRDCTPEYFVNEILVKKFAVKAVVCGYDFHFAKNRCGNADILKNLLSLNNCKTFVLDPVKKDGLPVSSTLIRSNILNGKINAASELLGRRYSFTLPVVEGRHIGTKIGFPTVNQRFPDYQLVPSFGVYSCLCKIDNVFYSGVSNIGVKPTVTDDNIILCETHILSFSENMYNKSIQVLLFEKIRDEIKFSSLAELKAAVAHDVKTAEEYFG
ncbi:MAG: bifunctional riboflavin kinase/FAD synthetase [Clostridia bacterium]